MRTGVLLGGAGLFFFPGQIKPCVIRLWAPPLTPHLANSRLAIKVCGSQPDGPGEVRTPCTSPGLRTVPRQHCRVGSPRLGASVGGR